MTVRTDLTHEPPTALMHCSFEINKGNPQGVAA